MGKQNANMFIYRERDFVIKDKVLGICWNHPFSPSGAHKCKPEGKKRAQLRGPVICQSG